MALSKKKKILVIAIAIIALFFFFGRGNKNPRNGYIFEKVKRADITEKVTESGNINTGGKVDIFSPTNGIVQEMYVKNGDIVTFGQKLFKVKSTATEAEKAAAYATYASAVSTMKTAEQTKVAYQAALEQARQAVIEAQSSADTLHNNRNNSIKNSSTGKDYTQLEIDSIESNLTSSKYSFTAAERKFLDADTAIGAAKANLTSAQLTYQATQDKVVKSTTIGTIANIKVSEGDAVSAGQESSATTLAGASSGSSSSVLTIANFSTNGVTLNLGESDIAKIAVGQPAVIDPDVIRDKTYKGKVKRVDDIGSSVDGVISYSTFIEIENPDEDLKSGMSVDVDITTQSKKNVLSVPNSAVKPYKGGRAVQVLKKDATKPEYVKVEIGIKGDSRTQIVKGLSEGDEIISAVKNENVQRKNGSFFGN